MARAKPIELPPPPEGPDRPDVLARVYPGYHEQAIELFQIDAENLAGHGYVPVAQSYAEGRYAQWYVTLAAILVIFVVGIVLLVYMAAVRPPGSLAVTYLRRDTAI
jgi:cytochrome b subunit of formate dehydrogenase